jgi:hypothetical protein
VEMCSTCGNAAQCGITPDYIILGTTAAREYNIFSRKTVEVAERELSRLKGVMPIQFSFISSDEFAIFRNEL